MPNPPFLNGSNGKTLARRVEDRLAADIRRGEYRPGDRLPGERRLAENFGVCRATVVEALSSLEVRRIIEKIPQRGTFVLDHEQSIRIAFAHSSERMESSGDLTETGFLTSDRQNGMLTAAREFGAEIVFAFLETTGNETVLAEQRRQLADYDAVIFSSDCPRELRDSLQGAMPIVQLGNMVDDQRVTSIHYDAARGYEALLDHAAEKGFRRVGVVSVSFHEDVASNERRVEEFLKTVSAKGFNVPPELDIRISTPSFPFRRVDYETELTAGVALYGPEDLILVNCTDVVGDIYFLASLIDKVPGRDFGLCGRGGGGMFVPFRPTFTYVKVPSFDMGFEAVKAAVDQVRNGAPPKRVALAPSLIVGESIRGEIREE